MMNQMWAGKGRDPGYVFVLFIRPKESNKGRERKLNVTWISSFLLPLPNTRQIGRDAILQFAPLCLEVEEERHAFEITAYH